MLLIEYHLDERQRQLTKWAQIGRKLVGVSVSVEAVAVAIADAKIISPKTTVGPFYYKSSLALCCGGENNYYHNY